MSLARGAWAAIAIGVAYLLIDGPIDRPLKRRVVAACLATAVILTGFFLLRYRVDPLTGRAGGGASVSTRGDLYEETLEALRGVHIAVGFGTERPRTESGDVTEGVAGGKYVPRAGTHSTFLNYVFRTGVPGAIAIFVVYALAWLHARTAAWEKRDEERVMATMLATSVVLFTAHATILSLYVEPIYTLSISLLVGMAMASGQKLSDAVWPPKLRPRKA
jgi:O-antigen ligase